MDRLPAERGTPSHQGGSRSRGLEEPTGETPVQGSRRTPDGEVHQGEGATGRNEAAGRHRHPLLRLPEPRRHRRRSRLHPDVEGHRRRCLRRPVLRDAPARHHHDTARTVWADTAYRSAVNEAFMADNGFVSRVHRKKPKRRPMPERTRRGNNAKSKIHSRVESVVADQKTRIGLCVRTRRGVDIDGFKGLGRSWRALRESNPSLQRERLPS